MNSQCNEVHNANQYGHENGNIGGDMVGAGAGGERLMHLDAQHHRDIEECANLVTQMDGETVKAVLRNLLMGTMAYPDSPQTTGMFHSIRNHAQTQSVMEAMTCKSK